MSYDSPTLAIGGLKISNVPSESPLCNSSILSADNTTGDIKSIEFTGTSPQVLTNDGTCMEWQSIESLIAGDINLGDLNDVNLAPGALLGDVILFTGSEWVRRALPMVFDGIDPNTNLVSSTTSLNYGTGTNQILSGTFNMIATGDNNVLNGSNNFMAAANSTITGNNNQVMGILNNMAGGNENTMFGLLNTINGFQGMVSGFQNLATDATRPSIIGGSSNSMTATGLDNGMFSTSSSQMTDGTTVNAIQRSIIAGGNNHTMTELCLNNGIIGGDGHTLNYAARSSISGGYQSRIENQSVDSTITGGFMSVINFSDISNITAARGSRIENFSVQSGIFGGSGTFISNGKSCANIAGKNNLVENSLYSSNVGGQGNVITGATSSANIGGFSSVIDNSDRSVIIGGNGSNIQAGHHDAVIIGGGSPTSQGAGTTTIDQLYTTGGAVMAISDERMKNIIKDTHTVDLSKLNDVRCIDFRYKSQTEFDSYIHHGFSAQNLRELYPELVRDTIVTAGPNGGLRTLGRDSHLSVDTMAVMQFLTRVCKQQQLLLDDQAYLLDEHTNKLIEQANKLVELEDKLDSLSTN